MKELEIDELIENVLEEAISLFSIKGTNVHFGKHEHAEEVSIFPPSHSLRLDLSSQQGDKVAAHEKKISKESARFTLIRGCPIRYFSQMEFNTTPMINLAPIHEDTIEYVIKDALAAKQEYVQFTYPPLVDNIYDLFSEVSELVHLFQEVVHHLIKHFSVYHFYSAILKHASHYTLKRKGNYFSHPVNSLFDQFLTG